MVNNKQSFDFLKDMVVDIEEMKPKRKRGNKQNKDNNDYLPNNNGVNHDKGDILNKYQNYINNSGAHENNLIKKDSNDYDEDNSNYSLIEEEEY